VEFLNQIILAGNLTDQPSVSDVGGRQFIPSRRLAQSCSTNTAGKNCRATANSFPSRSLAKAPSLRKTFQEGRQHPCHRPAHTARAATATDGPKALPEARTIFEIHVNSPHPHRRQRRKRTPAIPRTRSAAAMTPSRFQHLLQDEHP